MNVWVFGGIVLAVLCGIMLTAAAIAPPPVSSLKITPIAPQCSFVRDKTIAECRMQYEERYYDAGASNYPRGEKKIGIDICTHVGEAAFFACTSGDSK